MIKKIGIGVLAIVYIGVLGYFVTNTITTMNDTTKLQVEIDEKTAELESMSQTVVTDEEIDEIVEDTQELSKQVASLGESVAVLQNKYRTLPVTTEQSDMDAIRDNALELNNYFEADETLGSSSWYGTSAIASTWSFTTLTPTDEGTFTVMWVARATEDKTVESLSIKKGDILAVATATYDEDTKKFSDVMVKKTSIGERVVSLITT